jgi:hypothetical protein
MDTVTIPDPATPGADLGPEPLRAVLAAAWGTHATGVVEPDRWLDTALHLITRPALPASGDAGIDLTGLAVQLRASIAEVDRLHGETRAHTDAASLRRDELAALQRRVRRRALATLRDNPGLEDSLREALADWGLPPIPTDFTVEVSVPVTVTVTAGTADEARDRAAALLSEHLGYVDDHVTVHLDDATYDRVSND